ncbi:hypothetical protein MHU86_1164 [Fragilaria crotonensis]|nr:hypothetical protein MHU86_1164 [Fragilaria crotonensis]
MMPDPEHAFPDLAKLSGWQPLSKEALLVGRERDLCQMNNVDVAKRLRKPRQTKNKGKKASGEEQLGGLGQRKQDNPSLTKSPARKGEAKAVEEQDRPLLVTMSPAKIQDNKKMTDGAHTTTALLQGSEFVPSSIEHIAPFLSSFKKDFQNAASEDEKKNLCWQVLALSHEKSPLPFVDNALKFIRNNLEKENESFLIIAKHGKKDVLCGKGQRKCIPYLDRTLDFKNLHLRENVWKGINTKEVRKKVRDCLRKSVYFGKQSTVRGKRKAGDDNDACIKCNKPSKQPMTGSLKACDNNDACIECNKPSKHCVGSVRSVYVPCVAMKRESSKTLGGATCVQ